MRAWVWLGANPNRSILAGHLTSGRDAADFPALSQHDLTSGITKETTASRARCPCRYELRPPSIKTECWPAGRRLTSLHANLHLSQAGAEYKGWKVHCWKLDGGASKQVVLHGGSNYIVCLKYPALCMDHPGLHPCICMCEMPAMQPRGRTTSQRARLGHSLQLTASTEQSTHRLGDLTSSPWCNDDMDREAWSPGTAGTA